MRHALTTCRYSDQGRYAAGEALPIVAAVRELFPAVVQADREAARRRTLKPYGVFEVIGCSWIRSLKRMKPVHRQHDEHGFERLRHFVFTFHDKAFECVAEAVAAVALLPNDAETATTVRLLHLRDGHNRR